MQTINLLDMAIEHGDLAVAAEVTGRRQEILETVEAELRSIHGELVEARRDGDEFAIAICEDQVEMFTKIRNDLTTI